MQLLAIALATVIPLVVLLIIRALDLYQTGSFSTVLWSVAWGAIAFIFAYQVNSAVYGFGWFGAWEDVARFVAPPVEEILKILVLIYLVRRPSFTYFVDGAIYGFAAGMGFAVVENYQYVLNAPDAAFGTAIGRVISTNLIHACATALAGICIGLARFESGPRRWLAMLGGLAAGILLHGAFNNIVALIVDGPVLLIATVIALAALALIVVLIFRGLAQSRRWIEEKVGSGDRVTMGEARVVRRLEDVQELLKPLRSMFGEKKTVQIEELLLAQAKLGIQRAALDKLPDERMRRATQHEIDGLSKRMDDLRRAIGAYTMLAVRQIIPEENSPLWELLRSRIQERIDARPAAGGANLFASLGQRLAAQDAPAAPHAPSEPPPAAPPASAPPMTTAPVGKAALNPMAAALQARMAAAQSQPAPAAAPDAQPGPASPPTADPAMDASGLEASAEKGVS